MINTPLFNKFHDKNFWWVVVAAAVLLGVIFLGKTTLFFADQRALLAGETEERIQADLNFFKELDDWFDKITEMRGRHQNITELCQVRVAALLDAIEKFRQSSGLKEWIEYLERKARDGGPVDMEKLDKYKHELNHSLGILFFTINNDIIQDARCANCAFNWLKADFQILIGFKDFIYSRILNNRLEITSCDIKTLSQGIVKVDDVGRPAGLGLVMQSVKDGYLMLGTNPGENYISYIFTPSTLISNVLDRSWNFRNIRPLRAAEIANGGVMELDGIRFLLAPVLTRIDAMFDHYDVNGRLQPGWTVEATSGPYSVGWIHKVGVGPLTIAGYRIDNTRKRGPVPVIGFAGSQLEAGREVFGLVFDNASGGGLVFASGGGPHGGFVIQGMEAGTPYFSLPQAPGVIGTPLIIKEKVDGRDNCVVAGIYLGEKIEAATGRRIHAVLPISEVITNWNAFWKNK